MQPISPRDFPEWLITLNQREMLRTAALARRPVSSTQGLAPCQALGCALRYANNLRTAEFTEKKGFVSRCETNPNLTLPSRGAGWGTGGATQGRAREGTHRARTRPAKLVRFPAGAESLLADS